MSSVTIGFLVGGLTLVLLALRIHIGMAMLLGGAICMPVIRVVAE